MFLILTRSLALSACGSQLALHPYTACQMSKKNSLHCIFFVAGGSLHLSMTILFGKLSFLMSLIPQTRILLKIQQTNKNIYLLAG